MARKAETLTIYQPKVLLLAIQAPYNRTKNIESYFEEFINLATSNGLEYDQVMEIKLRDIDASTFLTRGKAEEVMKVCQEHNIDHVVVSEQLTPQQERNLTELLNARV